MNVLNFKNVCSYIYVNLQGFKVLKVLNSNVPEKSNIKKSKIT